MSAVLSEPRNLPSLAIRERFLAFAFAASDILIETAPDGCITFAAGAIQSRLGLTAERLIGTAIATLFAASDRDLVAAALAGTEVEGRFPPTVLHLADNAASAVVLAGLAAPQAPGRFCFTIGRLPVPPASDRPASPDFRRQAEQRIQDGRSGTINLVEMPGLPATLQNAPAREQRLLHDEITSILLRGGGPGSIAGEIAGGRYGLLGDHAADLAGLAEQLEGLLHSRDPRSRGVLATQFSVDPAGLTRVQAARALRFALARFAEGGAHAAVEAGFERDLASFVARAHTQTHTAQRLLATGQFRLAFQPVIHLGTRRPHHYEALIRPGLPPGHPIGSPQEFVTFCEAVGLWEELDWAVLQAALAAQRDAPHAAIAVNMSGLSMQSDAYCERAATYVCDRAEPGQLLIELTETADIVNLSAAASSVAQFRDRGIPVCLDDFGAGAAALRYLRNFRVDFVKLDGAYVRGAFENAKEHGFLLSMVELANFVGAKVIAEAVETEEVAAMMHEHGVEYGQGWAFGKPGALPGSLGHRSSRLAAPATQ